MKNEADINCACLENEASRIACYRLHVKILKQVDGQIQPRRLTPILPVAGSG